MHEPYRRRLPHIMPPGETLFITYRLHGTLPHHILTELLAAHEHFLARQIEQSPDVAVDSIRKRWDGKYFLSIDSYLDKAEQETYSLINEPTADIIKESIHFRDGEQFDLHAYCLMPNHVHLLVTHTRQDVPFYRVIGSMKANSAKKINAHLNRKNRPFWHSESYDHVVRNSKSFDRIVAYIMTNPVKAGFVSRWQDWSHSYCKYDFE
ncbi:MULTISPECIES: transposase [unclassified Spirosoma]|uniref:REP-associated tyrosine transposase n=1 Tax=unclassified Spirosoma TaxID=2621999 RepID=UPI00095974FF|nr:MULTISPECIES: transposase [unclassified Spirosoma]MBN8822145.1 transposase [Spirosoma sp.]OJW80541.1 MAG: hypothetical protein BGO59_34255 [Spirosoma sp. 48-14]